MAPAPPSWLTTAVAGLRDGGGRARAVLVAPSGHGKTGVLDFVAAAHEGPVVTVRGRRYERDEDLAALDDLVPAGTIEGDARRSVLDALPDGALLVVDDAQWLDAASARVLAAVADRLGDRDVGVVVARRPGDQPATGLDRVLGTTVRLGPLDDVALGEHLALLLDVAVAPELVDAVLTRTEGVPALADALVAGWRDDGRLAGGRLGDPAGPDPAPTATVDAVRRRLDELDPAATAVLGVLALGAALDDRGLAAVAGIEADDLLSALAELRAGGLLVPDHDDVVAVVAETVRRSTTPAELRARHGAVVAALRERGAPVATLVEHVVAADLAGDDAAGVLVQAATAVLLEDPDEAERWLERAVTAGAPAPGLAGCRAVAAWGRGHAEEALIRADDVAADAPVEDRDRARSVRAAVLADRGLWARAAADLAAVEADPAAAPAAVTALVATGDPVAARLHLDEPAGAVPSPGPLSLAADAARGAATSLLAAVAGDGALDLTGFADAAELSERRPVGPVPITPHALGAVVATAAGELTVARDLVERGRRHEVGGPAHARRLRLLEGWVALREGRWDRVEGVLAETPTVEDPTPQAVLVAALEAGLARRAGDLPRLLAAWERAEPLLARQPVSPFAVEPTAELVIAAHRLGRGDRVVPVVAALEAVTEAVPLWALVLDWLLLQAAVADDDGDGVAERARAVGARGVPAPRLAALAPAATAWLAVLEGEVHEDQVLGAAEGLVDAGLVWEASRLVGQGAVRTTDPALARTLLERARDTKGLLPAERGDDGAEAAACGPSVLSERELEVGALVLDGLTHKEIGAQLYLSPKTVEHHVAKIRQKLGVGTRAEMLAALRRLSPTP